MVGKEKNVYLAYIHIDLFGHTYVHKSGGTQWRQIEKDEIVGKGHWCGMPIERVLGYVCTIQTLVPRMRHLFWLLLHSRSQAILRMKSVYCQYQMQNRPVLETFISTGPWCEWPRTPSPGFIWILKATLYTQILEESTLSLSQFYTVSLKWKPIVFTHTFTHWRSCMVSKQRNWWYGSLLCILEDRLDEIKYDIIRGKWVN